MFLSGVHNHPIRVDNCENNRSSLIVKIKQSVLIAIVGKNWYMTKSNEKHA